MMLALEYRFRIVIDMGKCELSLMDLVVMESWIGRVALFFFLSRFKDLSGSPNE